MDKKEIVPGITLSDILNDNVKVPATDTTTINYALVELAATNIKLTKDQTANFWLYIDTLDLLDWLFLMSAIASASVMSCSMKNPSFIDNLLNASIPHCNIIISLSKKNPERFKKKIKEVYNKDLTLDEIDMLIHIYKYEKDGKLYPDSKKNPYYK